jgi:hypothetical protein
MGSSEFFYFDESGVERDETLWDEILGDDSEDTIQLKDGWLALGAAAPPHLLRRLSRDSERVEIKADDTFLISYPEFVQYFRATRPIMRHHLIIGASFTYAWMPTILDFRSTAFDEVAGLLERARAGHVLTAEEARSVFKLVNNSIVGASKLLHFVAPDFYAIWDQRVASYLGVRTSTTVAGAIDQCLRYWALCRDLARTDEAAHVTSFMSQRLGYEVTPLRAMELIMFTAARAGLPDYG